MSLFGFLLYKADRSANAAGMAEHATILTLDVKRTGFTAAVNTSPLATACIQCRHALVKSHSKRLRADHAPTGIIVGRGDALEGDGHRLLRHFELGIRIRAKIMTQFLLRPPLLRFRHRRTGEGVPKTNAFYFVLTQPIRLGNSASGRPGQTGQSKQKE